jgi:protein-S-isoprenylcysteine O-methyltransferase Ste14
MLCVEIRQVLLHDTDREIRKEGAWDMDRTAIRLVIAGVVAALALRATQLDQSARLTIGAITGIPSFAMMIVSRRQLGDSFSVKPEAKTLITRGLYSKILHPMYFFLGLFLLALIVTLGAPLLLLAWIGLVLLQTFQARREENVLIAAFGTEYEEYSNKTWF